MSDRILNAVKSFEVTKHSAQHQSSVYVDEMQHLSLLSQEDESALAQKIALILVRFFVMSSISMFNSLNMLIKIDLRSFKKLSVSLIPASVTSNK